MSDIMDFSDSGFQDQSNKAGPSNTKSNTSEIYNSSNIERHIGSISELSNTSKACIDLTEFSSDSDDEDNSYYVTTVWDMSDIEVLSPSPLTTSSPTYNGEAPCIILDNTEILEENNNDPNNNLGFIEIPQESISSTNINEISKDQSNKIDHSRELRSPVPGCSKDIDIIDNCKKYSLCHKMYEKVTLISTLLPDIELDLIAKTLAKNQYAKNYIELTLWDLLHKKRPAPQILSKRRLVDDTCVIERKKPVSKKFDIIPNQMQTSNVDIAEISCTVSLKENEYSNTKELIDSKFPQSCEEIIEGQCKKEKSPIVKDMCLDKKYDVLPQNSISGECSLHTEAHDSKDTISEIQEKKILNNAESKTLSTHSPIIRPAKLIVPNSVPSLQPRTVTCTNNVILTPPKLTYISKYEVKITDNDKPLVKHLVPPQFPNKLNTHTQGDDICEGVVNTINNISQEDIFFKEEDTQNCLLSDNGTYLKFSKNNNEVNSDTSSDPVSSLSLSTLKNTDTSKDVEILLPNPDTFKQSTKFVPSLSNDMNLPSTSKNIMNPRSTNVTPHLDSFQEEPSFLLPTVLPTNCTTSGTLISESTKMQQLEFDTNFSAKQDTTTEDTKLSFKMMKIYYKLLSIFPDVNPDYIKSICAVHDILQVNLDESTHLHMLIEHLLVSGENHPRVFNINSESTEVICDVNEQYENILGIFPDADPTYLRNIIERIYDKPEELKEFVQSKLESHDYPRREHYLTKRKIEQQKQYTTQFKIDKFLEIFPNPFSYFEDPKRTFKFNSAALEFLKHHYNKLRISTILRVYGSYKHHLSLTAIALDKIEPDMKGKRITSYLPSEDIPLLQEIAFIQHRQDIQIYLAELKEKEAIEFQRLKENNGLLECQCCFDNECMPSKCSNCDNGHIFCNNCIMKGVEMKLAESETHIYCFTSCTSEFNLSMLQKVLSPTTFSILLKKRQEAEVMAAGLEGLVSCPFCPFASIPPAEDKVFKCFNPECMKESCRLCKELNHVPLSCDEANSEKARHYLEEKMTQALIHTCYKCKRPFFKEEGCNKMVCVCGAEMCYICDKPVNGYNHFRGQGSTKTDLCPLWSDNHVINTKAVLQVARDIEEEMKEKNPNVKLLTTPLLPKLPRTSKGPHEDIPNSDVIPERAYNVRLKQ
ncbi:hypothetical protein KPH14_010180 [Odynerus spinipes]|uniref:RING-type domain-containing protein n=1 Tax=Odynerus spinipes TaxID=1348599 RepID=A0AAD9RTQ2_9HYME|nr:hypothetical protein KPH14_010180 [Odynerus spinipes]